MVENSLTVFSKSGEQVENTKSDSFYRLYLFEGKGSLTFEGITYPFQGPTVLFTSPYQSHSLNIESKREVWGLKFHGDFYCIEYHKKEVACNGLLFNNVYLQPHFPTDPESFEELISLIEKIKKVSIKDSFSRSISQSYLQLILALCTKKKSDYLTRTTQEGPLSDHLSPFQELVEAHFTTQKNTSFYADALHMSPSALTKKIKKEFGKPPSKLISERLILEAKKKLHLTRDSIKTIASELRFEDAYYFSRFFKKHTGLTPSEFRTHVGISIVAQPS